MKPTFDTSAVLSLLSEMIKAEFVTHYAYRVYAETLRDLSHDSIADHFEEHSDDEMDHAEFLVRRMTVIGGAGANVPAADAPPADTDPERIIKHMIDLELKGIENWKKLRGFVGDDPMYVTIEEYMAKEQEHYDDLMQLLPAEVDEVPDADVPVVDVPISDAFLLPSIATRVAESLGRTSKIVEKGGEFCVKSENNPDWSGGCYPSREKANKRLEQVEMFKHMKGKKRKRKKSKK